MRSEIYGLFKTVPALVVLLIYTYVCKFTGLGSTVTSAFAYQVLALKFNFRSRTIVIRYTRGITPWAPGVKISSLVKEPPGEENYPGSFAAASLITVAASLHYLLKKLETSQSTYLKM